MRHTFSISDRPGLQELVLSQYQKFDFDYQYVKFSIMTLDIETILIQYLIPNQNQKQDCRQGLITFSNSQFII